jgi:hypothetical protein
MSLRGHRAVPSGLWLVLLANPRAGFYQQTFDPLEAFNANGADQNRDYGPAIPGSRRSANAFGAAALP